MGADGEDTVPMSHGLGHPGEEVTELGPVLDPSLLPLTLVSWYWEHLLCAHQLRHPSLAVPSVAAICVCAKSLQSSSTLCDPVDRSPPDSSIHGDSLATILERVAMLSSRGSS